MKKILVGLKNSIFSLFMKRKHTINDEEIYEYMKKQNIKSDEIENFINYVRNYRSFNYLENETFYSRILVVLGIKKIKYKFNQISRLNILKDNDGQYYVFGLKSLYYFKLTLFCILELFKYFVTVLVTVVIISNILLYSTYYELAKHNLNYGTSNTISLGLYILTNLLIVSIFIIILQKITMLDKTFSNLIRYNFELTDLEYYIEKMEMKYLNNKEYNRKYQIIDFEYRLYLEDLKKYLETIDNENK